MNGIMVTGANGFLGRCCLQTLSGVQVCAVARSALLPTSTTVQWWPVDLMDFGQTSALVARTRPVHLLHLAWETAPETYWTSPRNWHWVDASLHLLRCFAEHGGRRAVLVGSCAEYACLDGACNEMHTPLRPTSSYGASKSALRVAAEKLAEEFDFSLVWARIFFLYGPHEPPRRLVPSVIRSLLAGRPARCTQGTQRRDYLHVSDASQALVALLDSDLRGPVDIGSGEAPAVCEVAQTIADILGRPHLLRLGALAARPDEPPLIVADASRLRTLLRWEPRYPLRAGLQQTIDWWRAQDENRTAASMLSRVRLGRNT